MAIENIGGNILKIIDEKGRIFGKWNIIDFLVVIFCLCLTPMFYFGYRIMTKTSTPTPAPTQKYQRLQAQVDEFLSEHKRARKYFEVENR